MDEDVKSRLVGRGVGERLSEGTVEIPEVGTIRVRGLNRLAARKVQEASGINQDHLILRWGVTDPELTDAEVDDWMRTAGAGEIEKVTTAIYHLSGMGGEDPIREAYKSS